MFPARGKEMTREYGVMVTYPDTNNEYVVHDKLTRAEAQEIVEQLRYFNSYPVGSFFEVVDLGKS